MLRTAFALALVAVTLTTLTVPASGQQVQRRPPNTDIQTQVGLTVNITTVQAKGIIGDDSTQVVDVNWTAQPGARIDIQNFKVELKVTRPDGSTETAFPKTVASNERTARMRVTYKGGEDPLTSFDVKLTTTFTNELTNGTQTKITTRQGNF
jgi:hypothetical protein